MRGGVPVLNRSTTKPSRSSCSARCVADDSPARPPAIFVVGADVDAAAQKRAGRDHDASRAETADLRASRRRRRGRRLVDDEASDGALHRLQRRVLLEQRANGAPIQAAIALGAGRPDRGPLAAVQHAELQRGEVGRAPHDSAERIDFANDGSFRHSADRRIARHLADRLERARDDGDARPARAAATAASVPACPAPTTSTSNSLSNEPMLTHAA